MLGRQQRHNQLEAMKARELRQICVIVGTMARIFS